MLNFLGALSSLLPGYIQGRRQAIQDNWQDLQNYNNIQAGQLSNAFTEGTWQQRMDMMNDAAYNSGMNTINNGYNLATQAAWFPVNYYRGLISSYFAPQQSYQDNWLQLLAGQKMQELAQKNPMALFPGLQQGTNASPTAAMQQLGS